MATFHMGGDTLVIPMTMFRENREKVIAAVKESAGENANNAYILVQGGEEISFNDTDISLPFRQESYFQYLFGVKEPGCYGVVSVDTGEAILFVPRHPIDYAIWMGPLLTPDQFKAMYEVDRCLHVDNLNSFFVKASPTVILTLSGKNSDSGLTSEPASFPGIENFTVDKKLLHPIIAECRVIKSKAEIEVLRYVAQISSDAHIKVMKFMSPGRSEYEGESLFLHHSYSVGGCRHTSYTCICGSGINSSILHYGHAAAPNDKTVQDGDICLFDMGANYCGYAADITCTFPANGKFTEDQKFIYNAVLEARNAVLAQVKEGVSWIDMHRLSSKVMLKCLKAGGMLQGDVDEMLSVGLSSIFQPHGLGHLLGLDVHDVGGYLPNQPERPNVNWMSTLRFARVLKAGMYVTVEPGCYFIDMLMNRALANPDMNKFIVKDVFERFRKFGGVRIEDDVLITETGCENFAIVPRTVEEIEKCMAERN